DLGCGNGVIGLTALAQNPEAQVTFVDESYMAVASSELNVEHNLPQELDRCQFEVNNALAGIERESVQAVLCNPPFHASEQEARASTRRKLHKLGKGEVADKPVQNFGGKNNELWCEGGEEAFV
ncbi:methyltransferase, partial [Escherichia coli]|uniref:methyltransferase n=1 Tax=Escherichia coli TaxID=562 RepID=UPI0022838692